MSAAPGWIADLTALPGQPVSADPLGFPGYAEQRERAAGKSGSDESVLAATATIGGTEVAVAVFDFAYMGGSMGEATGARIARAVDTAIERRIPFVSVTASGGARMQEGMRALVQMQRNGAAIERLRAAGIPQLAVARHPTTGGVWASLASNADVVIAEAGATVAFAGGRVRGGADDEPAVTAAGKLASGAVDVVVAADDLGDVVAQHVRILAAAVATAPERHDPPPALGDTSEPSAGWAAVQRARDPQRPRAAAYLDALFEQRIAISGDRAGGTDPQMLCGFGLDEHGAVTAYVAQAGGANTPAGFRTAIRLLNLAAAWGVPVLTLVDTPGAANDAAAEEQGIGTAIAQTFAAVARTRTTVPVTSLVIGEGGSGGALAIADPENLWAAPSSFFSVIAPEGAAAILHRDPARAAEVADLLHVGPRELEALGIVRGVVAPV
ncbi:MAG: carboxyl transferase domain-containing protein [Baekduia sp.]